MSPACLQQAGRHAIDEASRSPATAMQRVRWEKKMIPAFDPA